MKHSDLALLYSKNTMRSSTRGKLRIGHTCCDQHSVVLFLQRPRFNIHGAKLIHITASKAKRKLIKKQSAGILYLALYLIWSISSDKSDELQKLMEDSAVLEHTSSSNADSSPQVRLLRQDDATDHCVQPRQMQHDGETTATQDSQSSRHLLTRKCISLDRALVEAARRMEWVMSHAF